MALVTDDLVWPKDNTPGAFKIWEPIRTLNYREKDIFISSFRKSGTTWVQFILHCLKTQANLDFEEIDEECPDLEHILLRTGHKIKPEDIEAYADPRCFKAHPPIMSHLPSSTLVKRVICLRNPLDTALSNYKFFKGMGGVTNGFMNAFSDADRYVQEYFTKTVAEKPDKRDDYMQSLLSWWPHRKDPKTRIVIYEKLHTDRAAIALELADFWGIPADENLAAKVAEASQIENMRKMDTKFDCHLFKDGRKPVSRIGDGRVGRGQELSAGSKEAVQRYWDAMVKPATGCSTYEDLVTLLWSELWIPKFAGCEPSAKKARV